MQPQFYLKKIVKSSLPGVLAVHVHAYNMFSNRVSPFVQKQPKRATTASPFLGRIL